MLTHASGCMDVLMRWWILRDKDACSRNSRRRNSGCKTRTEKNGVKKKKSVKTWFHAEADDKASQEHQMLLNLGWDVAVWSACNMRLNDARLILECTKHPHAHVYMTWTHQHLLPISSISPPSESRSHSVPLMQSFQVITVSIWVIE